MQLVSTNVGGNLHQASDAINRMGLARYVLTMDFSGAGTVVVFKVPSSLAPKLRAYFKQELTSNPPRFTGTGAWHG